MFRISSLHYVFSPPLPPPFQLEFRLNPSHRRSVNASLSLSFARSAVLHSTERTNYRKSLKDARSRLAPRLDRLAVGFNRAIEVDKL